MHNTDSDSNGKTTSDSNGKTTSDSNGKTTPTARVVSLATAADLETFVSSVDIALVEFYTEGCGICASMEPVLSNVARGLDIAVGTVNPRDDPPLVDRFDVRSVPLFVLFLDGEPVARLADGFVTGEKLTDWIREHTD